MDSVGGGVTSVLLRPGLEFFFDESLHISRNHLALHKEWISQNTRSDQGIRDILLIVVWVWIAFWARERSAMPNSPPYVQDALRSLFLRSRRVP